ncbi:MAG: ornithine cyclodeaminase family protein [Proteobacteria bacterium]|nr:ornithine cyclodeaminase family protein [Burkholderiales bacterium]
MVRYLSEADIRSVLTMPIALDCVERAFVARAHGRAVDIPRRRTRQPGGHLHILQGAAPEINTIGYKAYYLRPDRSRTFLVHLIDHAQGNLEAMLEGDWMGQMRTGAATGVAARYLAREDASVVGLFGSGRHAVTQLEAVCAVRKIAQVKVFGRNVERLTRFCDEMSKRVNTEVRPAASREDTVRGADIVVIMTRADEPVFDGAWLEPGQFIAATGANALNRREIDLTTVKRSDVIVVDSVEVAMGECGDLLAGVETGLIYWENIPTLGDIIIGRRPGRTDARQITLYESHGMALQDLYTGRRVLELAVERGLGVELPIGERVESCAGPTMTIRQRP